MLARLKESSNNEASNDVDMDAAGRAARTLCLPMNPCCIEYLSEIGEGCPHILHHACRLLSLHRGGCKALCLPDRSEPARRKRSERDHPTRQLRVHTEVCEMQGLLGS